VNDLVGHGALLVSLPFLALGIIAVPVAVRRERRDWLALAYGSVYANFALVTVAVLTMLTALVTHDFSVSYVAQVGSRSTPLFYTIISLWGALEGSILFWAWVLSLYGMLVVWRSGNAPGNLVRYAAMMLLAISLFSLALVPTVPLLLLVCATTAISNGLVNPTLNGLASQMIDRSWQGRALSLMQSAGSVGRLVGPLLGGWLLMFDLNRPLAEYARTPFFVSAAILLVAFAIALTFRRPPRDKMPEPIALEADV